MAARLDLHALLVEALGTEQVYFQPPSNMLIYYPCIIYQRDGEATEFADNRPYSSETRYALTIIDHDPDSPIRDRVKALPKCLFERYFAADNLNHDVFTIHF